MPRVLNQSYDELVNKAQQLFWVHGYKGTSVKELAEHLNVSQNVIYNKYPKEMLFLDSVKYYVNTCSDPFLKSLRESTNGMEALKEFFYGLITALETKTFPRSCLMVNTVVELRNENEEVVEVYERYFNTLIESYRIILDKCIESGEIKHPERKEEYAEFLLGVIFGISVIFKVNGPDACKEFVNEQLKLVA